ncbi:MAG: protein translocase subunit SecF [Clostridia bacterium]
MNSLISKFKNKIKTFDINGNAKMFFIAPLAVVLIMIICGCCYQFTNTKYDKFANISVDFQGGTMMTVEFNGQDNMNSGSGYDANLAIITEALAEEGFVVSIAQSSGSNAIIVKYLNTSTKGDQIVDYNSDEKVGEMNTINENIQLAIADKATSYYDGAVTVNSTATLIGNSASIKLLRTALISVAVALALMLIYIIIRFDLYSGLAAVVALLHDILIMMSFTVIFYVEIGSTIVAGIITIVAYSINNTIVVFDRIRSNMKPYKKAGTKFELGDVVNSAIYSTMTRTLFTTLTTAATVTLLAIFGVASLQNFALPILFGLIAGFYSSAFLAAPMWGYFKNLGDKIKISNKNHKFNKNKKDNARLKKA